MEKKNLTISAWVTAPAEVQKHGINRYAMTYDPMIGVARSEERRRWVATLGSLALAAYVAKKVCQKWLDPKKKENETEA